MLEGKEEIRHIIFIAKKIPNFKMITSGPSSGEIPNY